MSVTKKKFGKFFDRVVKENIKTELSNDDLELLLNGRTKIVPYDEIDKYKTANQLVAPYGNAIILYLDTPDSGHWSVLTKRKGHFEFFDSYGYKPDEVLKYMHASGKQKKLLRLLEDTKELVVWNPFKLQKDGNDIATCGYYCFLRIYFNDMPLLKFLKIFRNKRKSPDYIASLLTSYIGLLESLHNE